MKSYINCTISIIFFAMQAQLHLPTVIITVRAFLAMFPQQPLKAKQGQLFI